MTASAELAGCSRWRREECGSAVVPLVDQIQWVPENLIAESDACTCHGDTNKAGQCERNRGYDDSNILSAK
jgi:hypothetical protein